MLNRKFIKIFFIISCLLAISFPLVNIYCIFPLFSSLLARNTEDEAVRLARHFSSMVIGEDSELKKVDSFEDVIGRYKEELNLEKIKIFSSNAEVIYSTDPEDIGIINDKSYFHEIVARGNAYSKIVQKETKSLEDQLMKVDVVETYVPIMKGDRFLGAFEIYYDITGRSQMLNKTVFRSSLISFLYMFGFFITMVILLFRADKKINEAQPDRQLRNYNKPLYLLFIIMLSLFIAEAVIMFIISFLPPMFRLTGAMIDAALLIMIVSPSLYFFLFRPLILHIEQRRHAEEGLKKAQDILVESNIELKTEIEQRKKAEKQMIKSQQEWEDTFNIITDMITIHDKDYNIIRANKAAEKILDLPFIKNARLKCFRYYHGTNGPPEGCPSCDCLNTGKPAIFEVFEPHLNRHIEIRAIPRLDENNRINGLIHVVRDITERKKMEDRLKAMSLTDELTGLYNRRGFFTLLEQELKVIKRQRTRAFLLYADIDNFKKINDSFGHNKGDLMLVETAGILRSTFRESDVIGRLGGDEFAVFLIENEEAHVDLIIARLQKNIDAFNAREARSCKLSMSLGVAPYNPEYFSSIDGFLAEADKMMYMQKKQKQTA